MEGKLLTDCKFCRNCHFTDGMLYASNPPKVKCNFTGEFHNTNDLCSTELKPVVHGRWEWYREENCVICSECKDVHYLGTYHQYSKNYCPNCGAKMTWMSKTLTPEDIGKLQPELEAYRVQHIAEVTKMLEGIEKLDKRVGD